MPDINKDKEEVLSKNRQFLTDNSTYIEDCLTWYKQYRAIPDKQRPEVQSNPSVPEMHAEIESIATAFHEMFFSDNTDAGFFNLDEYRSEFMDLSRNAQALLATQLEMIEFSRKWLGQCRWTPVYGTSFAKVPWLLRERNVTRRAGNGFSRNKIIDFDSFDYQIVSPFYMRYSPSSLDIQDGWVAVEYPMSFEDAKFLEKKGFFKNVQQAIDRASSSSIARYDEEKRRISGGGSINMKKNSFYVIEYYGQLESRDSDFDYRFHMSSDGIVLREPEQNPYPHGKKPFLKNNYVDLVDEFRGIGAGEINSSGQSEINERRALTLDWLKAFLYNMWVKLNGSNIDDEELIYSPNRVISSDMRDGLTPFRPPLEGLPTVMRMEDVSKEDMRRASAAFSSIQAIPIDTSVGQYKSLHAEGVRRIKVIAQANYATHLKNFLLMAHEMNCELLETPILSEVIGPDKVAEFREFTRKDIPKRVRIKIKTSLDSGSRIQKLRNFNELMLALAALVKADPSLKLRPQKLSEVLGKLYDFDASEFISEVRMAQAFNNPAERNSMIAGANEEFAADGRDIMREREGESVA